MAYLVNVDFGQILVIADNISEVDKKIKEAGIFHYEVEKVIEYVLQHYTQLLINTNLKPKRDEKNTNARVD